MTAFNRQTFPEQDSLLDNCLAVLEYPQATATVRSALVEYDGGRRRQQEEEETLENLKKRLQFQDKTMQE